MQSNEYARYLLNTWFTHDICVQHSICQLEREIQTSNLKESEVLATFKQLYYTYHHDLNAMKHVTHNLRESYFRPRSMQLRLYLNFTTLMLSNLARAFFEEYYIKHVQKKILFLETLPHMGSNSLKMLENKLASVACKTKTIENFQKLVSLMNMLPSHRVACSQILKDGGKVAYVLSAKPAFSIHHADFYMGKTHTGQNVWITTTYNNICQEKKFQNNPNILEPLQFEADHMITYYVFEFVEPLQCLVSSKDLTPNQISILHRKIYELFGSISGTSVEMQKCLIDCRNQIVVVKKKESPVEEFMDPEDNYSLKLVAYRTTQADAEPLNQPILGFVHFYALSPDNGYNSKWKTGFMYYTFGYYLLVMLQMATKRTLSKEQVPWISRLMHNKNEVVRKKAFDEGPRSKDQIQAIIDEINQIEG